MILNKSAENSLITLFALCMPLSCPIYNQRKNQTDYLASSVSRLATFLIPVRSVQKPQWQHPMQLTNASTSVLTTKFPDSTTASSLTENQNTTVGIIIPAVVHGESQLSEPAAGDLLVGSVDPDHQSQSSEQSNAHVGNSILSHADRPFPFVPNMQMHPLSAPFGMYPPFMHHGMFPQPPHPFMKPGMFPHPALSPLQTPNGDLVESPERKFLIGQDMRSGQGKRIGHAISKKLLVEGQPVKLSLYVDGKETVLNSRGGRRLHGNKKPVGTFVMSGNPTSGSARAALKPIQSGQPVPLGDPLVPNQNVPIGQFVTILPGVDIDPTTQLIPTSTAFPSYNQTTGYYFTVSDSTNFTSLNNMNVTATTAIPSGTTSNTTVDFFNLRWLN